MTRKEWHDLIDLLEPWKNWPSLQLVVAEKLGEQMKITNRPKPPNRSVVNAIRTLENLAAIHGGEIPIEEFRREIYKQQSNKVGQRMVFSRAITDLEKLDAITVENGKIVLQRGENYIENTMFGHLINKNLGNLKHERNQTVGGRHNNSVISTISPCG